MPFDICEMFQHFIEIIFANAILLMLVFFLQRKWDKYLQNKRINKALIDFYNGIKNEIHNKAFDSLFFLKDDDQYDVKRIIKMNYEFSQNKTIIEMINSLFKIHIQMFMFQINELDKDGHYTSKNYPNKINDLDKDKIKIFGLEEKEDLSKNIYMKYDFLNYLKKRYEENNIFIDKKSFFIRIFRRN